MSGGAAVGLQGKEQWGKDAALSGSGADGQRVVVPKLHTPFPVRQEVCDPAAGGVRHMQLVP